MSRRLVVLGHKRAQYQTQFTRVDNRFGNHAEVVEAGLPEWNPQSSRPKHRAEDQDYDLIRKRQIEEAIVRGDEL